MAHPESAQVTRAIVYTRVSSDRAGGRSVTEQEAECRAECERRGWPVGEVLIDNDRSATRFATKDRPEYERLRSVLRPGDVLVVWEASRAGRSLDHYVDLRRLCTERGVLLSYSGRLFDMDDGNDRFATGLDALIAEREAEDIRKRIVRAHRANLAAGKPHGRVPYGYKIVRDPETGRATGRVPDPARAPLVAEAARRVLDGHSLESTVRWIAAKDPDPRWNGAKLRRILLNPTSAGYRTQSHKVNGKRGPQMIHGEGTWEPLLTPEQHDDLVAMFAARKTGPRGPEPIHLLSGIASCAVCEEKIWRGKAGRKRDGSPYEVYKCRKGCVGRNLGQVDEVILSVVEGILTTPEALAALSAPPAEPNSTAKADLDDLRHQLQAIEDKLADLSMPADVGARVATRLAERIAELEKTTAPTYTEPIVRQLATAPDPVAMWRGLPLTARREFIRAVMTIEVERVTSRWHPKEGGILIDSRALGHESR
ncbi:MAG: recombinase family protein [Actinobacteria bacterium]|nr:recombinase family protein [Actinomycetota bacterium]